MIPIRDLFETHLTVTDLSRSITFYGEALGLELASVLPDRKVAFYWMGGRGNSMLGLWEVGTGPQRLNLHLAFRVDLPDLLQAPARLESAKIAALDFDGQPTTEPVVLAWMPAASLYFRDPDGNLLEFLAMLPAAPQPGLGVVTWSNWLASQHVQPQHPPHQKQRDRRHHDVTNPLPYSFRLGSIFHGCIVSPELWPRTCSLKTAMTQTDERAKVHDILKGFSTAMFVTFGHGGRPAARPMHVARMEEEAGEVWFFTGRGGTLVDDLHAEPIVLLAFQNDTSAYLSLRGRARLEHDRARMKELWKEPYKVWFPRGPEDPNIALVAVDLLDAEYWDNRGANKLEYLFEAAKAYVKGDTPVITGVDQHAKTTL